MSFNDIRENKTLAKISEFTVGLWKIVYALGRMMLIAAF